MIHRVLIYQGRIRGTRCGTDKKGWGLEKEPHDPDIVNKWSETTCRLCLSTRVMDCKRGHGIGRRRFNNQGAVICLDCTGLAVFRYRRMVKLRRTS